MNSAIIAKQTAQYLAEGGAITRIDNNIEAMKTLQRMNFEDFTVPLNSSDIYAASCPVHLQIKRHSEQRRRL